MGILSGGIAGLVTGRVGDMVFYVLNGKQVVRMVGKSVKPPTGKQLTARMQMTMVAGFLKHLVEYLNVGFGPDVVDDENAYNAAMRYNRKNALSGVYPDVVLDYSKVLVSKGDLPGAAGAVVELLDDGLHFVWSNPSDIPYPRGNDQVMLLAYFPALASAIYLLEAASREEGSAFLPVPGDLLAEHMEVYLSFVAADRKSVSDSIYLL
ncbi:MAG TPA: DUF6266 family protein [Pedobacter sp.]|uniref:DUF6266 family protein n=1 Tax=Pedobacter sp. TaxID=1411316 RepID=UPI002B9C3068|nr:DUF6266 family protein [Pedobacter sp.]HMI05743.1 DUF6266 family protein [Pedobacter sp.]